MANLRVLLDLDGVLADFVGGCCRVHGVDRAKFDRQHPRGRYSIEYMVSPAIGDGLWKDEFWTQIHAEGSAFWATLEVTPWASRLVKLVQEYTTDWHVVTAPCRGTAVYEGKAVWLKKWFGEEFDRFAITPHKRIFAGPNVVLIDDCESNVKEFREHGGQGILFPTAYNGLWECSSDPLAHVQKELVCKL